MIQEYAARLATPVDKRDHIRGSIDAPVTMVEYGDYECPFCGQAHLVLKQLEPLLDDEVFCLVFRNFPLSTVHPHAQHAAEAAEAAGAQGRFWDMHDWLFEHQHALDDGHLLEYAVRLRLDVGRFSRDMAEHRYALRVREDFLSGARSGVNGTPSFFINDMRYDGAHDAESLLAAIELAAAQA